MSNNDMSTNPKPHNPFEREDAENKLILLYLLNKMDMPITDLHITRILLENNLMNYFVLKDQLSLLVSNGFVETDFTTVETYVYSITDKGREIIGFLETMIPIGIRFRIDAVVEPTKKRIEHETSILADFTPITESNFTVSVSASENDSEFIELDLNVADRLTAIEMCDNWKKHTADIYKEILETMMKKRD